jgi:transcriptional regulator with XRE-family HTH domain
MRGDPALGAVVHRFRKREGLTQPALAERVGISAPILREVERGLRDPGWILVRAIARALDVSLEELLAAIEACERASAP